MDERELQGMRREPSPEFASGLRERLRRQGPAAPARSGVPMSAFAAVMTSWSSERPSAST